MDGMAEALRQARLALDEGEVPVGAALYEGDRLIWADHNRVEQAKDPTAHAEMLCLRNAGPRLSTWRLGHCTLYVTLEPCPMCAGAMVMSRLGRCVFGAPDPEKGCCGSVYDLLADPALHAATSWAAGEREEECRSLLQALFRRRREKPGKDSVP